MINPNDLPFLKLHLPVFKDAFDSLVCIADPEEGCEHIEYVETLGATVKLAPWQYDWGNYATQLFDYAEALGYDAAMRMDADECLFADAGYRIKEILTNEATLICFPRHEFFGDRYHVRGDIYPDHQARAWRLGRGIVVQGKKHEGIGFAEHGLTEHTDVPDIRVLRTREERLHIFHYGYSSPQAIYNVMLKYQRQAQVAAGDPPEVNFPPDQPLVQFPVVPFMRPQPLMPDEVGIYAPFSAAVDRSRH